MSFIPLVASNPHLRDFHLDIIALLFLALIFLIERTKIHEAFSGVKSYGHRGWEGASP